jgi:EmrB/QacA subfamily drug resistance transporter
VGPRGLKAGAERPLSEGMVLVAVALGTMLAPLNSTMIAVALPELLGDFERSLAWGSWIVTSYLVAMAAVQPLGGSLGDRYGRRRLFLVGLTLFLVATVVAALSWRIEVLLVARTVQAISGAAAIPNGTALVRSLVPPERRGRAFGNVGAAIAVAAGLGPPIGGILTAALGWRWIFAANLLLLAPALVLGWRLPAESPAPQTGRFDLRGATLLTLGLVSLVLALTIWRLPDVPLELAPALGLFAAVAGLVLIRHCKRSQNPVLNVALLRARGFTPAVTNVLLSNLAMYTLLLSLPLFLAGWSTWGSAQVGLLLAGLSLPTIFLSPLGGRLSDRVGRRTPVVLGACFISLGVLPFLAIGPTWSWPLYLFPLILVGAGLGLSMAPVQATAVETAPSNQTGQAAGLFSTMRYLGSILGSSIMAAVLIGSTPPVENFRILYAALFLSACGAIFASWHLPVWLERAGDREVEPPISPKQVRG